MKKLSITVLVSVLGLSVAAAPTAQAKVKVSKPSAPTIVSASSSVPKKGKVNVIVTITLPTFNGGSKITGSKISAGGKSCTIKKLRTSCTIKGIKKGKSLKVIARSKNKKGYGSKSVAVSYVGGSAKWSSIPVAPVAPAPVTPAPVAPVPVAPVPVEPQSPLRIVTNTCTSTTSAENCRIEWELDDAWEWSVSRNPCIHAEGGGAPTQGTMIIDLTGIARDCFFTVVATNVETGRIVTRELPITIRGLYPIPVFTITTNTCNTAQIPEMCEIAWTVDEDSEFSLGVEDDRSDVYSNAVLSARSGTVDIDLTRVERSLTFSIWATSLNTGRTTYTNFVITRPEPD
jgi:hypothetical protein